MFHIGDKVIVDQDMIDPGDKYNKGAIQEMFERDPKRIYTIVNVNIQKFIDGIAYLVYIDHEAYTGCSFYDWRFKKINDLRVNIY